MGSVHAEHVGPQLFVAERVEAEDGLSVSTRPLAIIAGVAGRHRRPSDPHELLCGRRLTESGDVRKYKSEYG